MQSESVWASPHPSPYSAPEFESQKSAFLSLIFFQAVAGRGKLIPLSLIYCSVVPVSQIKALSLPLFALQSSF